jgi:hypothetical protein
MGLNIRNQSVGVKSMQSLSQAWNLLLLATIFAFPLLLALLLHYRLGWAPRWVAAIATIFAPAVFFVFLAPILVFADIRAAKARGPVGCGNPAMAAILFMYFGVAVQLVSGLALLAVLTARRRRKLSATQT